MKNTRNMLISIAAAVGMAAVSATVYAGPHGGFWRGAGAGGPMGPGMMHHGGGHGHGMMGHGHGRGHGATATAPRPGFGPAAAAAGPVARTEQRLSYLRNALKITPEQETAWNAYAEQAKARASSMQALREQRPAVSQSTIERIEQRAEHMNLRAKQVTAKSAALTKLYAALTPEQKAVADLHFGGHRSSQAGPHGRWR